MKKNVVVIVVDSLSKKIIDEYPFKDELFLTELEKKSTTYTRMYSNGPFTEAAMNGLFAGRQNDEYGSYLFGYDRCPSNLFDFFESKSYNMYASGIMDTYSGAIDSTRDYIRHTTYHPILDHLSYTRLNDYHNILKSRGYLTNEEIALCRSSIKVGLLKNIKYSVDYLNDSVNSRLLKGVLDKEQVEINLKKLLDVCTNVDNDEYILNIVKNGVNQICSRYDQHFEQSEENKLVVNNYFNKILSLQRKHEPSRGKGMILQRIVKQLFKRPSLGGVKSLFGLRNRVYRKVKYDYSLLKNSNFHNTKVSVSFKRRVDDVKDFISNSRDNFFVYIQPQDFHPVSSFFSYDLNDNNIIKKEMEASYNLAKRIPHNKKCNIFPFLSLRYVDEQIKDLFIFLKENNLLENTIFVVTSDHGTWEYNDVVREGTFELMLEERSLVPCYMFDSTKKPNVNNELITNSSFPNILLNFCGFEESKDFIGKSNINDYIISTNYRFGSPDPFIKPCQYVVWYEHYKYIKNVSLTNGGCSSSFYNLNDDKHELKNNINNPRYLDLILRMDNIVNTRLEQYTLPDKKDYYESPRNYDNIFKAFVKEAKELINNRYETN